MNISYIIRKFNLYSIFWGSWCIMSLCDINMFRDSEEDGNCILREFELFFDDVVNYLDFGNIYRIIGFM